MTKILVGKFSPRAVAGGGSNAGKPSVQQTTGFERALQVGKAHAPMEPGENIPRSGSYQSTASIGQTKTYDTTKIISASDLVNDFRTIREAAQELVSSMPARTVPSVAIVQKSGSGSGSTHGASFQQIGGTIFVDDSIYGAWQQGRDDSGFETGLYQMIEARANSKH